MEFFREKPESREISSLTYLIDCRRHGEKETGEEEGRRPGITEKGKRQARGITTFTPPYITGDVFVSNIPRTRQTAAEMMSTEWDESRRVLNPAEEKIAETPRLGDEKFWESKEFRDEYFRIKKESGVEAAAQWYLDHGDQRPFGEALSPEEAAAMYASVILKATSQDHPKDTIGGLIKKTLVSHDLMMEPFLFYLIGDQIMVDEELIGSTFMEKIGATPEVSGFQIKLEKDGNDIKGVLYLQGKQYYLDMEKMKRLVSKYQESWSE